jgi:hypothetical protein
MDKDFDYYFAQLRRIEEHREKGAEAELRKLFKQVLKDTKAFIAEEYFALAENGELTFSVLQANGQAARLLEEAERQLNGLTPAVSKQIKTAVSDMYKLCYDGMVDAVTKSASSEELKQALTGLRGVRPEVVKAAVENPISGLTLTDTLEKNRKEIIWEIKRQIGVGLMNGDRYETMARRIAGALDGNYKKAVRIIRTEVGRAREAGHLESAKEINNSLKQGTTNVRMVKTWKTMKDGSVRDQHTKMDGVTVDMDEDFILPDGTKTQAPMQSGVASQDINCRCFLKYSLKETKEGAK